MQLCIVVIDKGFPKQSFIRLIISPIDQWWVWVGLGLGASFKNVHVLLVQYLTI